MKKFEISDKTSDRKANRETEREKSPERCNKIIFIWQIK
jgi:hypothetical protein